MSVLKRYNNDARIDLPFLCGRMSLLLSKFLVDSDGKDVEGSTIEIKFGSKSINVDRAVLIAVAAKNVRIPPHQWEKLEVLFVDGDSNNHHPENLILRPKDGGIESHLRPGYFIIPGFTRYGVNKDGEVLRLVDGLKMSPYLAEVGYYCFGLTPDVGKRTIIGQHRVLALAFKQYPANVDSLDVNHIDTVKTNNDLDNLEWASRKRNMDHAYENGLRNDNLKVVVRCIFTGLEMTFYSFEECARRLGIDGETVRMRAKTDGQRPFKEGLLFKLESSSTPWVDDKTAHELFKRKGMRVYYELTQKATGEIKIVTPAQCIELVNINRATLAWRLNRQRFDFGEYLVKQKEEYVPFKSLLAEMQG